MSAKLKELLKTTFEHNNAKVLNEAFQSYLPKEWLDDNGLSTLILDGSPPFYDDFFQRLNNDCSDNFYIFSEPDDKDAYEGEVINFKFNSHEEFIDYAYENYPRLMFNEYIVVNENFDLFFHVSDENITLVFGEKNKIEMLFQTTVKDSQNEILECCDYRVAEAEYYWGKNWKSKI